MEHVVFSTDADGVQSHHRFNDRDTAVRFVEHLRNDQGIEKVSLHQLVQVPLSFRAYYKVQAVDAVAGEPPVQPSRTAKATGTPVEAPGQPTEADRPPAAAAARADGDTAAQDGEHRRGLGFFTH